MPNRVDPGTIDIVSLRLHLSVLALLDTPPVDEWPSPTPPELLEKVKQRKRLIRQLVAREDLIAWAQKRKLARVVELTGGDHETT